MEIIVFNPSSAGASFTEHTNQAYLLYYKELEKNPNHHWKFNELRKYMEINHSVNNSNSRNMFTLLKDCGFVKYEKGEFVQLNSFFTKLGEAYAKTLESIDILKKGLSDEKNKLAYEKFQELKQNIICIGLQNMLKNQESNFSTTLRKVINFFLYFKSIDKIEYALLIYHSSKLTNYKTDLKKDINNYRSKQESFSVKVDTRDDTSSTKGNRILQEIGALTSYTYICNFLVQAGLVSKDNNSFVLKNDKILLSKKMLNGELDE